MKLIVYYDDNYPTLWIPRDVSKKIATFLKSKNFMEHNAENLGKWMEKSIDENTCRQSVVVFSQDVVPDKVCHTAGPGSLVREYLDLGGRIVWMGDIPFFYCGLHRSSEQIQYPDARLFPAQTSPRFRDREGNIALRWGIGVCFSVLGVMPLYLDFPSSKVNITKQGEHSGLQSPWYSIRPVLIKGQNLRDTKVVILATTKPLSLVSTKKAAFHLRVRSLQEVKEREVSYPSMLDFFSKFLGLIITLGSAMLSLIAGFSGFTAVPSPVWFASASGLFVLALVLWGIRWRERFASAWLKNFNEQYPTSGFIRLWDFRLHRITDNMLKELYDVALMEIQEEK